MPAFQSRDWFLLPRTPKMVDPALGEYDRVDHLAMLTYTPRDHISLLVSSLSSAPIVRLVDKRYKYSF